MRRISLALVLCLSVLLGTLSAAQESPDARVKSMFTTLRLREAPWNTSAVIAELAAGTPLALLGRTPGDGWFKVDADGLVGWVASGYVEVFVSLDSVPVVSGTSSGTTVPAATAVPQEDASAADPAPVEGNAHVRLFGGTLRLRDAPGLTGAILAELPGGAPLNVTGRSADGGWLSVESAFGAGWVFATYVDYGGPAAPVQDTGTAALPELPPAVSITGVRAIYQRGQALGNQRGVFTKIGDSITVSEYSLDAIGRGQYSLGGYAYLQRVIDTFTGSGFNSFTHVSQAAGVGWTTATALLPSCNGVTSVECELNAVHPSVALIQLGTNDVQYLSADQFGYNLGRIVDLCIERGVVPVLATIPYREGFGAQVDTFNDIIRGIAASKGLPVWDVKSALDGLPNRGLSGDNMHPSWPPAGWADSANFANAEALNAGYTRRNLAALQVLDGVLNAMGT